MSFFSASYGSLAFPIAEDGRIGLRPAQIAATQAVASHFFGSHVPAIVTMPTGAGKTTVLMMCAFMLRANRVLVITPSRLVREQIAENFKVLGDLKKVEALPLSFKTPKVFATQKVISTPDEWLDLRKYDVVVATVPSIGGRGEATAEPPADLFDLVLVDEAHHSPASTWARVLSHFAAAKQVLFTATPFRRDDKEIKGRFVFSYDLRQAYNDRVFGDIYYRPIPSGLTTPPDIAIAQAAERQFKEDRERGFNHLVMVRVDSIARGKELTEIYEKNTKLRLAFVSGADSLKKVGEVITKLKAQGLDGIICVNMFGEGFNLPALKIAAVHSPHKSLAVTLQFIGRFARTSQKDVGSATFIAEPLSSNNEISELYETGAIWRDIVQNLSETRIDSEMHRREVLDSFAIDAVPDMDDFSLYTIRPYFHAKVYRATSPVALDAKLEFPHRYQEIFRGFSEANSALVYLTRQTVHSAWCTDERFTDISYDLFIFHYEPKPGLLFICASRRDDVLYARLAAQLLDARPRILAHSVISRALNDLKGAEFFSVGMRKRHTLGRVESYRTSSGSSTDRAIDEADAKTFGRGHCFGTALEDGRQITIGVSASSKVWSNTYDQIPELLAWCGRIAEKIDSGITSPTGSKLDLLSAGEELAEVPAGIIAIIWPARAYRDKPLLFYHDDEGKFVEAQLLDFDFEVTDSQAGHVRFAITNDHVRWNGIYRIANDDLVQPCSDEEPDLTVHASNTDVPIAEYLNAFMPIFYCTDLSSIDGVNILPLSANLDPFGEGNYEIVDWKSAGINIEKEIWDGKGSDSIFDWVSKRLLASPVDVIFCDHGSGEMADFIAIQLTDRGPLVSLYHCKASGKPDAGKRVDDLYEACGQAVKCTVWLRPEEILDRFRHRQTLPSIRGFIKGDLPRAEVILSPNIRQQIQFEVYIVQPGLLKRSVDRAISELLASTKHYLVAMSSVQNFGIINS